MWYKEEVLAPIDYSYLDLLFDNQQEADDFLRIFIRELEVAKPNIQKALTRRNTQLYRQTLHNVSPHLEMLKVQDLGLLLQQAREKIMNTKQPFEDKQVFICAINTSFDKVISEISRKLMVR